MSANQSSLNRKTPLVSLIMVTYNHEPFIREALEGAAVQTYSPLEIVVCDDASTDATASIVQEFVASYRGPHTWCVIRNDRNLGILGNCSQALALTHGEIIMYADGDDVSLPERVQASVRYYEAGSPKDYVICKALWVDRNGNPIPCAFDSPVLKPGIYWNIRHRMPGAWGTCSCHHRMLLDVFGSLATPGLRLIDAAMAFRAVLLGGQVRYLNETLVRYRQHEGGVASSRIHSKASSLALGYIERAKDWALLFQQMAIDIQTVHDKGIVDDATCCQALRMIREEVYASATVAQALKGPLPIRMFSFVMLLIKGLAAMCRNLYAVKSAFVFRR